MLFSEEGLTGEAHCRSLPTWESAARRKKYEAVASNKTKDGTSQSRLGGVVVAWSAYTCFAHFISASRLHLI
jgi:hypothetical protein